MAHGCLCKMKLCSRTLRVGCPWPCGGVSARPGGGCGGRAEGRRSQTQGIWSSVRPEDACSWGHPGPPRGACSLLPPAWSLGEGPLLREQSSPVLEAPRWLPEWGVVLGPLRFPAQAQRLSWASGLGAQAAVQGPLRAAPWAPAVAALTGSPPALFLIGPGQGWGQTGPRLTAQDPLSGVCSGAWGVVGISRPDLGLSYSVEKSLEGWVDWGRSGQGSDGVGTVAGPGHASLPNSASSP